MSPLDDNLCRVRTKNDNESIIKCHFLGRWSFNHKGLGRIVKIYRRNMNVIDEYILSMWICISELIYKDKVRR